MKFQIFSKFGFMLSSSKNLGWMPLIYSRGDYTQQLNVKQHMHFIGCQQACKLQLQVQACIRYAWLDNQFPLTAMPLVLAPGHTPKVHHPVFNMTTMVIYDIYERSWSEFVLEVQQ